MRRLTAKDFPPEALDLYGDLAHGRISKRQFLNRAGKLAIGGMTAGAMLAALTPDYARAEQVSFTDPDILPLYIAYPSPAGHGSVRGYLVRPAAAAGKLPGVVVVHENRGLNPYIKDVARRLAKAGFVALAPDGLTSLGGYPGNDEKGRELQSQLDPGRLMNDFFAAVDFLAGHEATSGRIGMVGFCWGGMVANMAAVTLPDLAAAVPFYGRQPPVEEVARIRAPLLLHYAGNDERVNAGWPAYEAALKQNGKTYEAYVYPDVNHAFHNDTTPRYDAAAAELAWGRTLDWFRRYLA